MAEAFDGIKNISGRDLVVPSLGGRIVFAGQAVPCPLDEVTGFTQQEGTWAPHGKGAQKAHDEMLAAIAALLGVEDTTPASIPEEN